MCNQSKKGFKKGFATYEGMGKSQLAVEITFLGTGFNNWTKLRHQKNVQTVVELKSKSDRIKRKENA